MFLSGNPCWENRQLRQHEFCVRNTESWERDSVPLWDEERFRREILEACSRGTRLVNLFAGRDDGGSIRIFAMLGNDDEGRLSVFSMRVAAEMASFPSLTPELAQAHLFEREIAEQFAIVPVGHPWLKPVRYQELS